MKIILNSYLFYTKNLTGNPRNWHVKIKFTFNFENMVFLPKYASGRRSQNKLYILETSELRKETFIPLWELFFHILKFCLQEMKEARKLLLCKFTRRFGTAFQLFSFCFLGTRSFPTGDTATKSYNRRIPKPRNPHDIPKILKVTKDIGGGKKNSPKFKNYFSISPITFDLVFKILNGFFFFFFKMWTVWIDSV